MQQHAPHKKQQTQHTRSLTFFFFRDPYRPVARSTRNDHFKAVMNRFIKRRIKDRSTWKDYYARLNSSVRHAEKRRDHVFWSLRSFQLRKTHPGRGVFYFYMMGD
jgi:hypothetical protein